ncbi:MAG: hypothetical protein ACFFDY_00425 [Candidatus Thorarchaeota archaeon]
MNFHYWFSVIIEIVGICTIGIGLVEMCHFGMLNPANLLITSGSLMLAIGSAIFAKYIKWNRE